jgi:hypothetical protein
MHSIFKRVKLFIGRHPLLSAYFMATTGYLVFTVYYMGGAITNCSVELLAFPGDHTAGLFSFYSIDKADPWWGHTDAYSYPYGESLWQPYHITSQVPFVSFWVLAKLFGPVCGFNLLVFIGFMSAALVTFGFVRWLFGRKELLYNLVAFLAGYAVVFTPFMQRKAGGHIAYLFAGLLVASVWLFLKFWRKPRPLWAVLFGLSVAILGYIDGYFVLLGGVLIGSVLVATYIYELLFKGKSFRDLWQRTKLILLSGGVVAVCLMPIAYVQLHYADQIKSAISSLRDDIMREAQEYGARPYDYLLLNPEHPLILPIFGEDALRWIVSINTERSVIGVSKAILLLAIFMTVVVVYRWRKKQRYARVELRYGPGFILLTFGLVVVAAFLLSMPPHIGPIPTLTNAVIQFTDVWRVFARLSVVVNMGLVVLASYGLIRNSLSFRA